MRYLSHWSDKGNGREGGREGRTEGEIEGGRDGQRGEGERNDVSGSQFDYIVHWGREDMEMGA